jgi:hypothetical protein
MVVYFKTAKLHLNSLNIALTKILTPVNSNAYYHIEIYVRNASTFVSGELNTASLLKNGARE